MGHSSLNVSLTYLRGLEVAELTEMKICLWFRISSSSPIDLTKTLLLIAINSHQQDLS